MHPDAAEASITRTYLEWLVELPWQKQTKDTIDIKKAKAVLDEDHYDLEKIKERILEYLAVRKLRKKTKGPILCFLGPPGVGKTSLGRSIARAMGRNFVRISLGGIKGTKTGNLRDDWLSERMRPIQFCLESFRNFLLLVVVEEDR